MSIDDAHAHFWSLSEPLLAEDGIARGTMMGLPCLRVDGQFFASVEHKGTRLIVKLPKARVAAHCSLTMPIVSPYSLVTSATSQ